MKEQNKEYIFDITELLSFLFKNKFTTIEPSNLDHPTYTPDNTIYKIIFNGNPNQFLTLMKEKDIDIDTNQEIWKVR